MTRQRTAWQKDQLDRDLVSHMAKTGKAGGALSILDDDLEAYKREGAGKKKQPTEPAATEPPQDGAVPMES